MFSLLTFKEGHPLYRGRDGLIFPKCPKPPIKDNGQLTFQYWRGFLTIYTGELAGNAHCPVMLVLPFSAHLGAFEQMKKEREAVTTQMLLNSKCLHAWICWFYTMSVVGFAVSLFACNVPSELKRVAWCVFIRKHISLRCSDNIENLEDS